MTMSMNLNAEKQTPTFIPINTFTDQKPHSNTHCEPVSSHHNTCTSSPCPHNGLQRQCHMHDQYVSNCHACNTVAIPDTDDSFQLMVYQKCQCYRCQKGRGEPVLHPLIGLPLGIATGGLSCAAIGIYRSIAIQHAAKKLRKQQAQGTEISQTQIAETLQQPRNAKLQKSYAVPSPVSAVTCETHASSKYSEMEDTSPTVHTVSEIDGSPVEAAPPRYSEVVRTQSGMQPGGRVGDKL